MRLGDLLVRLPGTRLHGDPATEVTAVTHDSRQAGAGSLFVAIKGAAADGNTFVDAALKKGAAAVASEEPPRGSTPWLQVPSARQAGPGALFVAIKGAAADGNTFVDAARRKGAAAIASEEAARGDGA